MFAIRTIALVALIWVSKQWGSEFAAISEPIDNASCFSDQHIEVIVRALMSNGRIDPNARRSLINTLHWGAHVAFYMTPCVKCRNAKEQAKSVCDDLNMLPISPYAYIDVTDRNLWTLSRNENIDFLNEFADALYSCSNRRYVPSILTIKESWEAIMGVDYSGHSEKKLWYVHLDGNIKHDDFVPFGGWTEPCKKTYIKNFKYYGYTVDRGSELIWDAKE